MQAFIKTLACLSFDENARKQPKIVLRGSYR